MNENDERCNILYGLNIMPQFTFKINVGNLLMVISFLCIIFYRERHYIGGKKFSIFKANYVSEEKSADN